MKMGPSLSLLLINNEANKQKDDENKEWVCKITWDNASVST